MNYLYDVMLVGSFRISFSISYCLQMAVQLKTAQDDNASLQQALKSEIESHMQLEGTLWFTCHRALSQFM